MQYRLGWIGAGTILGSLSVLPVNGQEGRLDWFKKHIDSINARSWFQKMDIGPAMAGTFQDQYNSKNRTSALKGILLEISPKQQIYGVFDTETLRLSSAGLASRKLDGTPWTGRHGALSRLEFRNGSTQQTLAQPAWAALDGSFTDTRPHPGHGNLSYAKWNGHFRHGEQIILDYSVHTGRVLETITGNVVNGNTLVFRQFELAPCKHPRTMLVSDDASCNVTLTNPRQAIIHPAKSPTPKQDSKKSTNSARPKTIIDHTRHTWGKLAMGAPSNKDSVDRSHGKSTYFRVLPTFNQTHKQGGDEEGVAVRLNDGQFAANHDDVTNSFFFDNKAQSGRLVIDFKKSQPLQRIHLYSWHRSNRSPMRVTIYAHTNPHANESADEAQLEKLQWKRLSSIDTSNFGNGGKHGAAVFAQNGQSLGQFSKLLFICHTPEKRGSFHTFFSEIDVWHSNAPALKPRAVDSSNKHQSILVLQSPSPGIKLTKNNRGQVFLQIPASKKTQILTLGHTRTTHTNTAPLVSLLQKHCPKPRELHSLTHGAPPLFPQDVMTQMERRDAANEQWVTENIPLPTKNPWGARMRVGDFDFFSGGDSAAICTWTGDVWIVRGLNSADGKLHWRRFACGLFEPLGLKIVNDIIHIHGRDQITRLHDLNGDGEADHYKNFNNDILITKNFHEFAFSLETDSEGNFYFTKGAPVLPGGRGFDKILPHNGIVARIPANGKGFEVLATGLRAPGGLGVGPNGEITTGENEGSWMPSCKINYFTNKYAFLGVEDTAHHLKGRPMHLPLCYLPMWIDNSGGAQQWVPQHARWGLKSGELIHLSYGRSALYRVLHEEVDGIRQGGVVRIPVKLHSSAQRACFHPDGSLYVSGFRGWQTNAATPQAFQRIRFTGGKLTLPDQLRATTHGVYIRFPQKLDPASAQDIHSYKVERWKYVRSSIYGSGEFSVDHPDPEAEKLATQQESKKYHHKRDQVRVIHSTLLEDGQTIFLQLAGMKKCEQMSIKYQLKFSNNKSTSGNIINTIHRMSPHKDMRIIRKDSNLSPAPKDLVQGLHQTISNGYKQSTARVTAHPAAYLQPPHQISDMIKPGSFTSSWMGFLRITERKKIQFKLEGHGKASLSIAGKNFFNHTGSFSDVAATTWQANPGNHPFLLTYHSSQDGTAHVRVLWKYDDHPWHPIPSKLFSHQPDVSLTQSNKIRAGKNLFHQHNCQQCHHDETAPAPNGPSLAGVGARLRPGWMAQWILNPHQLNPQASMPALLNPSTPQGKQDAADIAAYLASLGKVSSSSHGAKPDPTSARHGGAHFHRLGCVACHGVPEQDASAIGSRIPLDRVAAKFHRASLIDYLLKPNKHYPQNKMPDFRLNQQSAQQLADYLISHSKHQPTPALAGDPAKGKKRAAQLNCAACHDGLTNQKSQLPSLQAIMKSPWHLSTCVSNKKTHHTPRFNLTQNQRDQLEAFRVAHQQKSVPISNTLSPHDLADQQIHAHNCTACHENHGKVAALTSFHTQSKHLLKGLPVPDREKVDQSRPKLTHAGEMLHTDYLSRVIAGNLKQRARPWLSMKMPSFHAAHPDLATGLAYQHGLKPSTYHRPTLKKDSIQTGAKLIGSNGGFACTICHGDKEKAPLAAFEVEGVNFALVAPRLRNDYYFRWMHNPHSINPTTKMPRYTQGNKSPLPDYQNDADKQFQAILQYLHSRADQ